MDPNETRAVARLPRLDVEIVHRAPGSDGVETLTVTLRGSPSLDAARRLLDPFGLLATWSAFNPWLAAWAPPAALPPPRRMGER